MRHHFLRRKCQRSYFCLWHTLKTLFFKFCNYHITTKGRFFHADNGSFFGLNSSGVGITARHGDSWFDDVAVVHVRLILCDLYPVTHLHKTGTFHFKALLAHINPSFIISSIRSRLPDFERNEKYLKEKQVLSGTKVLQAVTHLLQKALRCML